MGTAVLRSQDCLKSRFPPQPLACSTSKKSRNPNSIRSGRRRRSSSGIRDAKEKFPAKNLVMGQVTILKRGEELKIRTSDRKSENCDGEKKSETKNEESFLFSTDRLGPEPEMVPKQIRLTDLRSIDEAFSGSAFSESPSPSSVPLPAFTKKNVPKLKNNDAVAKDLCRLLGLHLF